MCDEPGGHLFELGVAGRSEDSGHRSFGLGHAWVRSVGVNLVAREFSRRALAGDDDGTAGGIHLDRVLQSGFRGQEKEFLQHLDDIVIGVLVVVKQDDMEKTPMFLALNVFQLGNDFGSGDILHRKSD